MVNLPSTLLTQQYLLLHKLNNLIRLSICGLRNNLLASKFFLREEYLGKQASNFIISTVNLHYQITYYKIDRLSRGHRLFTFGKQVLHTYLAWQYRDKFARNKHALLASERDVKAIFFHRDVWASCLRRNEKFRCHGFCMMGPERLLPTSFDTICEHVTRLMGGAQMSICHTEWGRHF